MRNLMDRSILVVGISLVSIIVALVWSIHEHNVLKEAAAQRDASLQTFEQLSSLKGRWSNSAEVGRKSAFLLAHPALIRQERRQKSLYLEYANLSGNEFDRIVSTLMNAPFIIKKLDLTRNANRGSISVEIEQ